MFKFRFAIITISSVFFFLSFQQTFKTEDHLLILMRDNTYSKNIFIHYISELFTIFSNYCFSYKLWVRLCTLKSMVHRSG
jgi:hypothetical protein